MSKKAKLENLKKVKNNLADKYLRLAKAASSKVKRLHFMNKSAEYRLQARRCDIKMEVRP